MPSKDFTDITWLEYCWYGVKLYPINQSKDFQNLLALYWFMNFWFVTKAYKCIVITPSNQSEIKYTSKLNDILSWYVNYLVDVNLLPYNFQASLSFFAMGGVGGCVERDIFFIITIFLTLCRFLVIFHINFLQKNKINIKVVNSNISWNYEGDSEIFLRRSCRWENRRNGIGVEMILDKLH